MFFPRRLRPLEVSGARVRSLRASLNAPVFSAPDLPVGTARSVIVVHREARGGWDATVGVRSERGGQVAYWSFDGELATETDLDVASDAALTFAESLGFVFDDSTLGGGEEADKCWRAWLGGEPSALAPAAQPKADARSGAADFEFGVEDELLELELVELAHDDAAKPSSAAAAAHQPGREVVTGGATGPGSQSATQQLEAAPPLPAAAASQALPPPLEPPALASRTLSKFRSRAGAAPAAAARKDAKAARQPLARLQLVKRRSPEEERRLLLRKLLTSF